MTNETRPTDESTGRNSEEILHENETAIVNETNAKQNRRHILGRFIDFTFDNFLCKEKGKACEKNREYQKKRE